MAAYSTVRPTFWTRGSGRGLRGDTEAQVLALYLMTCQHANMCGIFSIGLPTIAHETGLSLSRLPEIFARIEEIASYDQDEELCFVPAMAKYQIGEALKEHDKRRPKLLRELGQFSGHPFIYAFHSMYHENFGLPENKGHPETEKPLVRLGKVRLGKGGVGGAKKQTVAHPIPDDWAPNEKHIALAKRERLDCARMAEMFRAHALSVGRLQKNWDAAFTTWLLSKHRDRDRLPEGGITWGIQ